MKKSETLSEEIEQKRYRHFMFILYKDSESFSFDDVLFDLKGSFKNYAYIFHKPEKDEKKEIMYRCAGFCIDDSDKRMFCFDFFGNE